MTNLETSSTLRYSEEEAKFIHDNYLFMSDSQIAKVLKRTRRGISMYRVDILKLKKIRTGKPERMTFSSTENKAFIYSQIDCLVNFIETTKSTVWRDIANTKRKELLKHLNKI